MSNHYRYLWWEKTGVADSENTIIMRIFVLIVVIKVCPTPRIKKGDLRGSSKLPSVTSEPVSGVTIPFTCCLPCRSRETVRSLFDQCFALLLVWVSLAFTCFSYPTFTDGTYESTASGLLIAVPDTKCSPQTFEFFVGTTKFWLRTSPSHSTRRRFPLLPFPIGKLKKDHCSAVFLAFLRPLVQFITQQWSLSPILIR